MAYKPFKMKGHTLPGINQRSEGNTDLPDGRSGSSPFQQNSTIPAVGTEKRKQYYDKKGWAYDDTISSDEKYTGPKIGADTERAQEIRKGIKDYTPEQIKGIRDRNIAAFEYGHLKKGERYRKDMPDFMQSIALSSDSVRATIPPEMFHPPAEEKKEDSPTKAATDPGSGEFKRGKSKPYKGRIGTMGSSKVRVGPTGAHDEGTMGNFAEKLGITMYPGMTNLELLRLIDEKKRGLVKQYEAETGKSGTTPDSPNKWVQFIPMAISAISSMQKSKEDK